MFKLVNKLRLAARLATGGTLIVVSAALPLMLVLGAGQSNSVLALPLTAAMVLGVTAGGELVTAHRLRERAAAQHAGHR